MAVRTKKIDAGEQTVTPAEVTATLQAASRLVHRAQLAYIGLLGTSAEMRPLDPGVRIGSGGETTFSLTGKDLSALITCEIKANAVHAIHGPRLLRITAQFEVRYATPEDSSNDLEAVEAFARVYGLFNVWPYWREYVQSTFQRFGLPSITLPLLKPEQAAAILIAGRKQLAASGSGPSKS